MREFLLAVKEYACILRGGPRELLLMSHPKNTRFRLQRSPVKGGLYKKGIIKAFCKIGLVVNLLIPPRGC